MQLAINGIDIEVKEAAIAQILRERFMGASPAAIKANALPQIGEEYQGGIYVGLTLHDNAPCALVLLPGEAEEVNWKDAGEWADKQGGTLPSRVDQLILFQSLKREFKDAWYWSGAQYAPDPDFAWCQDFSNGDQLCSSKGFTFRARAVRRIPIE